MAADVFGKNGVRRRGPRVLTGLDTQGLEALVNYLDFYFRGNGKTAIKWTRAAREKEGKDENRRSDAVQPGVVRSGKKGEGKKG